MGGKIALVSCSRLVRRSIKPNGFSLLELVVVVCLIAILFTVALNRYNSYAHEARVSLVTFQATTFARTIENIRALSVLYQANEVDMGNGILVWINQAGWPYTSSSPSSRAEQKASAQGCENLWLNIFSLSSESQTQKKAYQFEISLIDGRFCRYMLAEIKADNYFFDYDLLTGTVEQRLPE